MKTRLVSFYLIKPLDQSYSSFLACSQEQGSLRGSRCLRAKSVLRIILDGHKLFTQILLSGISKKENKEEEKSSYWLLFSSLFLSLSICRK
jgi:hypothetical protein